MRGHTIGIRLSSPLLEEGVRGMLRPLEGVSVAPAGRTEGVSLMIADPFTLSGCPEGVPKVGVIASHIPPDVASQFSDTVGIYDAPAEICRKIKAQLAPEPADDRCSDLSPRERDVILLIVKGLSNKEIAARMNVSVNTVMTHRRNIASKLKIHSPAGLTIFALATGLVKMEDITD